MDGGAKGLTEHPAMNRQLPEPPGGPQVAAQPPWRAEDDSGPPRACVWPTGDPAHIPGPRDTTQPSAHDLTQVVNTKLHLEAVLGGPVGAPHHSRIVDQDVYLALLWKTGVRANVSPTRAHVEQQRSSWECPQPWAEQCP